MSKFLLSTLLILYAASCFAQENNLDQEAADFLRQSNKLYVVITILVTIFAALILFLVYQERKISKLEKHLKTNNHEQERQPGS